jgi:hypothetical protein
LDGIDRELEQMDAITQEASEKYSEIQMALPGLVKAYEGFIIRQNEI